MHKKRIYYSMLFSISALGLVYLLGLATQTLALHPFYGNLIAALFAALTPLLHNRIPNKITLYIGLFSLMAMVKFSPAPIQSHTAQSFLPLYFQLCAISATFSLYFYDLSERKNPVKQLNTLIKNCLFILVLSGLGILGLFSLIKFTPPAFTDAESQSLIVTPGDSISSSNYESVFYIKPHSPVPSKNIYWKGGENLLNSGDSWGMTRFNFLEADTIQKGDFFEYDYVSKPTPSVGELTMLYFADHFNKKAIPVSNTPLNGQIFVRGKDRKVFKNVQAYLYNDPNDTFPYVDTSKLIARPDAYFRPIEQTHLLNGQFNFAAPTDERDITNSKTRKWGERLRNSGMNDVEIVNTVLRYFLENNFKYTRQIPYKSDEENRIDSFLFDNKTGYCQHYSASLALLLNSAGVPTKVVTGFSGMEPSKEPGVFKIVANRAHAWNEVWLQGYGWVGVDPTSYGVNIEPPPGIFDQFLKWIQESSESMTGSTSLVTTGKQTLLSQLQDKISANYTVIYMGFFLLIYLLVIAVMLYSFFKKKKVTLERQLMLAIMEEMVNKKVVSPENKNFWKDAAHELLQKNHPWAQEFEILVKATYSSLYESHPLDRKLSSQLKRFLKKVKK